MSLPSLSSETSQLGGGGGGSGFEFLGTSSSGFTNRGAPPLTVTAEAGTGRPLRALLPLLGPSWRTRLVSVSATAGGSAAFAAAGSTWLRGREVGGEPGEPGGPPGVPGAEAGRECLPHGCVGGALGSRAAKSSRSASSSAMCWSSRPSIILCRRTADSRSTFSTRSFAPTSACSSSALSSAWRSESARTSARKSSLCFFRAPAWTARISWTTLAACSDICLLRDASSAVAAPLISAACAASRSRMRCSEKSGAAVPTSACSSLVHARPASLQSRVSVPTGRVRSWSKSGTHKAEHAGSLSWWDAPRPAPTAIGVPVESTLATSVPMGWLRSEERKSAKAPPSGAGAATIISARASAVFMCSADH